MPEPGTAEAVDLVLGDAVRVRLVGAGERERRMVADQLGLVPGPPAGEADVEIEFVDRLLNHGPLRHVTLGETAFDDDRFIVLRGKQKTAIRASLPLADVGGRCHIVCERGLGAVPYLIAVVNLTALARGYVPIHAAAFVHGGRGILVTGWAKGGKTETLLAFAERGATYVGDEWVYLAEGGARMFGVPEPMKVWSWHLDQLPRVRAAVPFSRRVGLAGLAAARRAVGVAPRRRSGRGPVARVARRLHAAIGDQLAVHLPPERIFGAGGIVNDATIDDVLFVVGSEAPSFVVREIDGGEVARRMSASVAYETLGLWSLYLAYRFAFPDRANDWLEGSARLAAERLRTALAGKHALEVRHPYPFSIAGLADAVEPHLG